MKDYDYFINNLSDLYAQYGHCFLAIKNQKVVGVFDEFKNAYYEMVKTEELGTFIIQECVDDPEKLVHRFQFNVTFSEQVCA